MTSKAHALSREELIRALTSYTGIATNDGAANGTTIVDTALINRNDFIKEKTIIIMSGDAKDEDKGAMSFVSATGVIALQGTGFSAQIKAGTIYRVLNISTVEIDVEAIKVQTDKLAGEAPVVGTTNGKWKTGTGTSGETGADLVTIGANDTKYKLHSLLVNISALTAASTVTVKLFMQVKGTERKVYSQPFTQGTDPDGLWIVNGTVGIHEALRVEVESDTDDDKDIDYDYMLEAM